MANELMLHTKAEVLRENISVEEGVIDAVVGSTSVLDRMGDVIDQDGWQLDTYTKTNPVILWGHNVREERPPIGKALKVWIEGKQQRTKRLMFKVKFDLQDSFAAEIFRKVKDGFINTVSVGFLPAEWEELDKANPFAGRKYTKQELLELSFVPVPANPEAVIALRSLSATDKRFEPIELKDLYPEIDEEIDGSEKEMTEEEVIKPYENEHACRLVDPDQFQANSFRRMKRKHQGKEYSVLMAKKQGEDTMMDQSFRYGKDIWSADEAGSHCKAHGGSFEPAKKEDDSIEIKDNSVEIVEPTIEKSMEENLQSPIQGIVEDVPNKEDENMPIEVEEAKGSDSKLKSKVKMMGSHIGQMDTIQKKMAGDMGMMEDEGKELMMTDVKKMKGHVSEMGALCDDMMGMMGESLEGNDEEIEKEVDVTEKGVIPYRDLGIVPESDGWDGPGEIAKADVTALKAICTWYDSENADNKSAYKLPHHKTEGYKAVWRGVAAAMAALLGARGGVSIPDADKKGVYNHLKKHYAQFDKEAPDFKMVEDQVLAQLDEELLVLALEREEKYEVRLIKKVLKNQNENKIGYTSEQIEKALGLINLTLSFYKQDLTKGGEK